MGLGPENTIIDGKSDGDFESLEKRYKKQNADKDEILDLNTTVTLKTFINQIDKYIEKKLRSSKTKKTITFGREDIIYESKIKYYCNIRFFIITYYICSISIFIL